MIILLLSMLLILSIVLLLVKNNLHLVMFFSVFSFLAAAVYYFSQAPDIALAEVAVGSAFIPLVYLIAISKQKKFTVLLDFVGSMEGAVIEPQTIRFLMDIMEEFCNVYGLELNVVHHLGEDPPNIQRVFRVGNVDLICHYHIKDNELEIRGNTSNVLLNSLEEKLVQDGRVVWKRVKDHETAI